VLLLLGITLVQSGLSRQLSTALPAGSPSAFLIDIQRPQWQRVQEILSEAGAESINSAPVVTARLESIDGQGIDDLVESSESRGRRWALTREQRVTYLDELAPDNKILDRASLRQDSVELWTDPRRWELSVEEDYAQDLGLEVGTELVLDVQGLPIEFTVTSIRSVDWGTFDLNFFLVAEPAALEDAPQYRVATVRLPPGGEQLVQDRLAATHQNVTMLRIRDVLAKVKKVLDRLAFGVQFLGGFTVLAGLVILAGAVSANSVRRGREIALLKTLGMVRREIALMFTLEFALLGLLAGSVGAVGGVVLSHTVLTRGMEIGWSFRPFPIAFAVGASVLLAAATAVLAGSRALSARLVTLDGPCQPTVPPPRGNRDAARDASGLVGQTVGELSSDPARRRQGKSAVEWTGNESPALHPRRPEHYRAWRSFSARRQHARCPRRAHSSGALTVPTAMGRPCRATGAHSWSFRVGADARHADHAPQCARRTVLADGGDSRSCRGRHSWFGLAARVGSLPAVLWLGP
jgi:hypothetical protein